MYIKAKMQKKINIYKLYPNTPSEIDYTKSTTLIQSKLFNNIKIQFKFKQAIKRCNVNNVGCLTPRI